MKIDEKKACTVFKDVIKHAKRWGNASIQIAFTGNDGENTFQMCLDGYRLYCLNNVISPENFAELSYTKVINMPERADYLGMYKEWSNACKFEMPMPDLKAIRAAMKAIADSGKENVFVDLGDGATVFYITDGYEKKHYIYRYAESKPMLDAKHLIQALGLFKCARITCNEFNELHPVHIEDRCGGGGCILMPYRRESIKHCKKLED